uniref:CBL-interacting protein kinase 6 n=1 Tax=Solanum tuberosum TaxID=4113 RepID=M1C1W9_SOLTU
MSKLESLAKKVNFHIVFAKEFKVKMQGTSNGRKGKLSVLAEVIEVAPDVAIVQFSKSAGDTFLEYKGE